MKGKKLKNSIVPLFLLLLIFSLCVVGILNFGKANQMNHQKDETNGQNQEGSTGVGKPENENDIDKADNPGSATNNGNESKANEDSESSSTDKKLLERIDSMTLEEKVGQLFFARCDETTAVDDITNYHLGGFILFANNFKDKSKEEVINNIRSYQEASNIPMLIGVDEEGGTVVRVSKFEEFRETPFLSPRVLYTKGGMNLIIQDTYEKAELLKELGINVNLAPVCDLSFDVKDYMYDRTFGVSVEKTSEYITSVVLAMKKNNLGSVLKHFPGYGNNVDTHTGIAYDNRSYETFQTNDFLPFIAGIKAGANSILVSHNIVKSMDDTMPASLSSNVHKILREELAFDGVIMTDDLSMDAITKLTGSVAAAITAINAGNDLLIATDYKTQIPAVIEAVNKGDIKEETIDDAVLRVLKWKVTLGLLVE